MADFGRIQPAEGIDGLSRLAGKAGKSGRPQGGTARMGRGLKHGREQDGIYQRVKPGFKSGKQPMRRRRDAKPAFCEEPVGEPDHHPLRQVQPVRAKPAGQRHIPRYIYMQPVPTGFPGNSGSILHPIRMIVVPHQDDAAQGQPPEPFPRRGVYFGVGYIYRW